MSTIRVNDNDFYYRDEGQGDPILLIHGGGPDADTWGPMFSDLATDHRVVAYSRRGFHASGSPATSWRQHGDDAVAIMEGLGITGATVVGQSAGGIVAVLVATTRPDYVRALVLIEPALYMRKALTPDLIMAFAKTVAARRRRGARAGAEVFLRYVMGRTVGGSTWDRADYPQERRELLLRNAEALFADIALGDGREVAPDDLTKLKMPVTIISGEATRPRYIARVRHRLTKLIPDAKVVTIPDSGHALAFDNPSAGAAAIRAASVGALT